MDYEYTDCTVGYRVYVLTAVLIVAHTVSIYGYVSHTVGYIGTVVLTVACAVGR